MQQALEEFAERIFLRSAREAADYFSLFYQRVGSNAPGELQYPPEAAHGYEAATLAQQMGKMAS